MAQELSPLFFERYELKYLVDIRLVDEISRYVEDFCEMDHFSKLCDDHFYVINSLYFDTPTFRLIDNKENQLYRRYNLRVRSYAGNPKPPFYFETKLKEGDFVKKRRAKIEFENWWDVLHQPEMMEKVNPLSRKAAEEFRYLTQMQNANPVILTQYRRKAYLSLIDDYARVTFDRDLRFQFETGYNVHPNDRLMNNYDHLDTFDLQRENFILELKCERRVPFWMLDLIKRFELVRVGFSKFHSSLLDSHGLMHAYMPEHSGPSDLIPNPLIK